MNEKSDIPIIIDDLSSFDKLFPDAVWYVVTNNDPSAYSLVKYFGISYARAFELREQMELAGIIGKPRYGYPEILVTEKAIEDIINRI